MNPIEFPGHTTVFAKDQPEYLPLPAHRGPAPKHCVTSCWRLSWTERLKLLFTGRIWLQTWTFGGPLQPQRLDIDKPGLA